MKALVLGATGNLGYACCLEFIRRGHSVEGVARKQRPLGAEFSEQGVLHAHDIAEISDSQLTALMLGVDVLVYALGPDDRMTPKAPALEFFRRELAERTERVITIAKEAGVPRAVLLGSYFTHFDRAQPKLKLAERHPYVQARVEQAERAIKAGGGVAEGGTDVMVLEIPYAFGVVPGRVPFWKEALFDNWRNMKTPMYPAGGTAVVSTKQVGEAALGAALRGKHGECYPIADLNMTWNEMIALVRTEMRRSARVLNPPAFLTAANMRRRAAELSAKGQEAGLNPLYLSELLHRKMFLEQSTVAEHRRLLAYAQGGVPQAIRETVWASYPEDE